MLYKILFLLCLLKNIIGNKNDSIEFHSMSGSLHCKKLSNGKLQLDFPGYEISSIVIALFELSLQFYKFSF